MSRTPRHTLLLFPVLALSSLLSSCASNPTGGADFVMMRESAEIKIGQEMKAEIAQQMPIYRDQALEEYVERIGQKLVAVSHRPDLDYSFTIIDSPDINAFALPGGPVYINRGLMAYLNSEAQLAAVLGHEIAHITARHAVRQDAASKSNSILSGVAILATGVRELGETTALLGGTVISGYGRDMELEADGLGAEYLLKAGYDPNAMVEVVTVLKNQEDFTKRVSGESISYHGLFATHPRNDTRLIQAVNAVGELAPGEAAEVDPAVFRERLEGLPLGQARQTAGSQDRNRYYQNLLNYTVVFPDGWQHEETPTTVTASAPDEAEGQLHIAVQRRQSNHDARNFIEETLGIADLQKTEALAQFGLHGYTGTLPDSGERLAVIHYGPRAYILRGSGNDAALMTTIRSFRPILRNEQAQANPVAVRYVQVREGTTYAQLAAESRISPEQGENLLRLLNGDYPSGEPQAGAWVKIAQ